MQYQNRTPPPIESLPNDSRINLFDQCLRESLSEHMVNVNDQEVACIVTTAMERMQDKIIAIKSTNAAVNKDSRKSKHLDSSRLPINGSGRLSQLDRPEEDD